MQGLEAVRRTTVLCMVRARVISSQAVRLEGVTSASHEMSPAEKGTRKPEKYSFWGGCEMFEGTVYTQARDKSYAAMHLIAGLV